MNKKHRCFGVCCLILILILSFAFSISAAEPGKNGGNMVLVSGSHMEHISLIDAKGNTLWKLPQSDIEWEEVNDADMLTNGNIVFAARASFGSRVYMIKPNYVKGSGYDILWSYKVPSDAENHTCQALPDGGILLCEAYSGYIRIVELDENGQVRLTLGGEDSPLPEWPYVTDRHSQVRQIYKTKEGTYLVASMSKQKTIEYDAKGNKVAEYVAGGFTAVKDKNGNVIVAGGDSHRITCFNASTKKVMWTINQKGLGNSIQLGFVAAIDVKENGNLIFANWGGHGGASGDAVIEITPPTSISDPQVVWSLNSGSSTSTVQVIDHVDPAVFEGKVIEDDKKTGENTDIEGDKNPGENANSDGTANDKGLSGAVWLIVSIAAGIVIVVFAVCLLLKKRKSAKHN